MPIIHVLSGVVSIQEGIIDGKYYGLAKCLTKQTHCTGGYYDHIYQQDQENLYQIHLFYFLKHLSYRRKNTCLYWYIHCESDFSVKIRSWLPKLVYFLFLVYFAHREHFWYSRIWIRPLKIAFCTFPLFIQEQSLEGWYLPLKITNYLKE